MYILILKLKLFCKKLTNEGGTNIYKSKLWDDNSNFQFSKGKKDYSYKFKMLSTFW